MDRKKSVKKSVRQKRRQPLMLQRSVPRALSLEIKGYDSSLATGFVAAGTLSGDFTQIAAAGGLEDRVGLRVTYAELQFRYCVQGTVGAGGPFGVGSNYLCRVIILQTSRQGLAITDVLDNTLGINVFSPYNLANIGQSPADSSVYILHDKTYNLNPAHHSSADESYAILGKDLQIPSPRWNSAAAVAPVHGGLQLITLTNQTVVGQFPALVGSFRALFTDA